MQAQTTTIPDPAFEQALIDLGYDDIIDGIITTANIVDVTHLDVSMKDIEDLTGIEDFVSLSVLDCHGNQLTSLEFSQMESLSYIGCHNNQLTSLDISQFQSLWNLDCYNNQLNYLDVSQHNGLVYLSCGNNELDTLIMPEASQNFRELEASNNNLTHLEMTNYALIAWIAAENNQFNSVDLSGSTAEFLVSFNNNLITEINLDGSHLRYLLLENNQLSFLDLSDQSNLQWFSATSNPDLDCIKINQNQVESNPYGPDSDSWTVDPTTSYAIDCPMLSIGVFNTNSLELFPNPCHDLLTLGGIPTGKDCTIYSLDGKKILTTISNTQGQVGVQGLENGTYLLSIKEFGIHQFYKI